MVLCLHILQSFGQFSFQLRDCACHKVITSQVPHARDRGLVLIETVYNELSMLYRRPWWCVGDNLGKLCKWLGPARVSAMMDLREPASICLHRKIYVLKGHGEISCSPSHHRKEEEFYQLHPMASKISQSVSWPTCITK